MPWANTPADRARSTATYQDPEYKRNKAAVRRRSGGRCEWVEAGQRCGSRNRVECDHRIPRSQGGTHALENLWDLCKPHHNAKTATEGGGWRNKNGNAPADPALQPRTRW